MLNKKLMILTLFTVSLLAISAVSAADNTTNDVVSIENNNEVVNMTITDDIESSEENVNESISADNQVLSSDNSTINIKSDTSISAFYDYESSELVATVTNDNGKGLITVNVLVNINNIDYTLKTNSKGEVKLPIADLEPGIYTASVSYNGNNKYNPSYTTVVVNNKLDTSISAFYDAESRELIATVTNDNGKGLITVNVLVNINGVDYALRTDSKGKVKVSTANLDLGNYAAIISYNGNNKYNPVTATANFTVNKVDTNIVAYHDAESRELIATVSNAVSGKGLITVNVLININGEDYTLKTDSKGQAKLSIADLTPGTYTASVSYKGNNRYYSSNTTVVLNTKSDTTISAVYDKESKELVATVSNAVNGKGLITVNVLVNLNGMDYTLKTDSKGQVKLSTVNLTPGTYIASISYNGNNKYNPSSTKIFVINKLNTGISVFFDAESKELVTTLTKDNGKVISNVNVLVNLNGVDYTLKTDSKGQAKVSTANLDLGDYTSIISYNGNSKYYPATAVANFTVNKVDTNIVAYHDAESRELIATVSNAVSGKGLITTNVLISINGEDYTLKTDSKGQAKLSTTNLDLGNYTATISYNGNNKHNPVTATANFTVNKVDSNIVAYYDAESKELIATVSNAVSGKGLITVNVLINLNGEDYTLKTDSKGQAKVSTANLNLGNYTATISYNGNNKHNPVTATANFTVNKVDSNIVAYYDAESKELIATVSNAVSGKGLITVNVLINLNGEDYTLKTDSKGQAKLSTANLDFGTYIASVYYKGNSKYYQSNTTAKVINKADTSISAFYDGESKELIATVSNAVSGKGLITVNVLVNLNGVDYTLKTDSKGQVKVSCENLTPGNYYAIISYNGNSKYYPVNSTFDIVVSKDNPQLSAYHVSTTYGEDAYLVATLKDSKGNAIGHVDITVDLNNETHTLTTDYNGNVQLSIKSLTPNDYTAVFNFAGNDYYFNASATATVNVYKLHTMLTFSSVTATYGCDNYLIATLTASSTGAVGSYTPVKGATIVIIINNQETDFRTAYGLTTDSNGQVKFNTKTLLAGTYSVELVYYGDSIHKSTVGQDISTYGDSTITINRANPTITASGVTTTYGTEGFVTATLKDHNGNAMANKLVTFTFADGTGKTVLTDAYGKAKLSTSGYNGGTYKLTVKYTPEEGTDEYDMYNSVSATATMKINKLDAILYARYAPNQYGYGEWIVNKDGKKVNNFNEYSGEHKDIYIYAEDSNGNPIVGATVINKAENDNAITNSNGAAIFDMYWPMLGSPYERNIEFVLDSPNYNEATVTVHLYVVRRV